MKDVIIKKFIKSKLCISIKFLSSKAFLEFSKTTVTMLMCKIQKLLQYVDPVQLILYL